MYKFSVSHKTGDCKNYMELSKNGEKTSFSTMACNKSVKKSALELWTRYSLSIILKQGEKMIKTILLLIGAAFSLFSCSLAEPACLLIENKSAYTVKVSVSNGLEDTFELAKGKGSFVLAPPGKYTVTFTIEQIGFIKDYQVEKQYLEKKKVVFKVD